MPSTPTDLDHDALLETARILSQAVPADALNGVRATLEYLHHADREVTPKSLRDLAPCDLSTTNAENIVYQLAVEGVLDDGHLNVGALGEAFVGARLVAAQADPPENTVVATIPYDDQALDPGMFEPLHGNLLELIRSAENDLVLMSPFLNEQAYERLRPALITAADNGADITLITRYLTYGDKDFNREFVRRVAANQRLTSATTYYEYIDDETWTTFHAKMVISDGELAYLGTANLTHKGLGGNLELGVIFRDDTASRLTNLVENLRQSEFFYQVSVSGQSFHRC